MDIYSSKGWSNRRRLAELKNSDFYSEERVAIRRERQAGYDEEAAANEAAKVAREAATAASEIRCPGCGGTGHLHVPQAMRIVKGLYLVGFHDHAVTAKEIASLAAIAKGDPIPPGCAPVSFSYGAISPAPGVVSALPTPDSDPVAVETPRPARTKKSELPESRNVEAVTHDGFLIET